MCISFKGVGFIYKAPTTVLFGNLQVVFLKFCTVKEHCSGIGF